LLKSFWFRLIHNRTEKVSSTIIDDLKWFLDLNYIAEDAAEEATASLYENVELSREIEPVGILLGANEYVEESKARSTEEEYPVTEENEQFVRATAVDYAQIFGSQAELYLENDEVYSINNAAFANINAYLKI